MNSRKKFKKIIIGTIGFILIRLIILELMTNQMVMDKFYLISEFLDLNLVFFRLLTAVITIMAVIYFIAASCIEINKNVGFIKAEFKKLKHAFFANIIGAIVILGAVLTELSLSYKTNGAIIYVSTGINHVQYEI